MNLKRTFLFAGVFLAALAAASLHIPFPRERLDPQPVLSCRITDRNHILLREILSDEGGRCRWVKLQEISPYLLMATIATEDKNFFFHSGLYLPSIIRASVQNLRQKRVVSGASTISQQLIRNIYHFRRNGLSKILEGWLALRLERTLSKGDILAQYLNRISYGNQAYGIEAASRLYFDKPAAHLSLAESAFLAGLPQSPNSLNPYRNVSGARKKQQEILRRMGSLGLITREEQSRALEERLSVSLEREKFRAPHFCDFVLRRIPSGELRELSEVRTTLDYGLQSKIEILLRNHLNLLEEYGITNGAVIVLDNRNGEILSMVGSKDFFDEGHDGQVNGATSLRQPGSALKPFTYALALEKGMTAATLIEDGQAQFLSFDGYYMPRNYDRKYHGVIRLRSALACSYNIPAISVLQTVGQDLLFRRLKELGFESLQKNSDYYGLGLTLGNGEVTLLELVRAYAALARGGMVFPETFTLDSTRRGSRARLDRPKTPGRRVFSPEVASITTDILSDKDARIPSFGYYSPLALPFPVAAKTGTSKDFRDNWTVGYTTKYTVGVWVGNFDGRSMHNVSGITGCGPLFKDIMLLLHKKENAEEFPKPENLVELAICPQSGELPSPRCPGAIEEIFIRGTEPQAFCSLHTRDFLAGNTEGIISRMRKGSLQVISPQSGDIFKIDPVLRREFQRIRLKASIPEGFNVQFVEWWVNSKKVATVPYPYRLSWQLSPGSYTVKAIALEADHNKLESRPVTFTVLL